METKRQRVRGSGPTRKELVTFKKLGTVDKSVIDFLTNQVRENSRNDLGTDMYSITRDKDLEGVFGVRDSAMYRQLLMQLPCVSVPTSEFEYSLWDEKYSIVKNELSKYFLNVYRFRVSVMSPNSSINWHIDTDTSVCCRAQISISDNDSVMEFKTKDGVEELHMEQGGIYFINVGWPHRVVTKSKERISAIFSFSFDDIILPNELYKI